MINYEPKRTIKEILDVENGNIINSEDFFKKSDMELIPIRRRLEEAILGLAEPKYVCIYCNQKLALRGAKTQRGVVSFFAHKYDSEECEIKTNNTLSKTEIEVLKYSRIRESKRHLVLKNEIATALSSSVSKSNNIKNVKVEKRVESSNPFFNWRVPDVSAEFCDKKIVFELQLSTTFISTVVGRDIFYQSNDTFILWVFNFEDNEEYVNIKNLMCKDIYYSNKQNAFIFDIKARDMSKKENELVLLCLWFEPLIENGIYKRDSRIKKEEYVRLRDLKFDSITYKPYFVDAERLFLKYEPELIQIRKNEEKRIFDRISILEKKWNEIEQKRKELKNEIEQKRKELKKSLFEGSAKLEGFRINGKWGYKCKGEIIVEPTYSSEPKIQNDGNIIVYKNKNYGIINKVGELIYDCVYNNIIYLYDDVYLYTFKIRFSHKYDKKYLFGCLNVKTKNDVEIHKSKSNKLKVFKHETLGGKNHWITINYTNIVLFENFSFKTYDSIGVLRGKKRIAWRGGKWIKKRLNYYKRSGSYEKFKFIKGTRVVLNQFGEELI